MAPDVLEKAGVLPEPDADREPGDLDEVVNERRIGYRQPDAHDRTLEAVKSQG